MLNHSQILVLIFSYFIFCQTQFKTFQPSSAAYTSQYIGWLTDLSDYSEGRPIKSQSFFGFYRTQVRSLPCLVSPSVLLVNFLQIGFVLVVSWISLSCSVDLSKLMYWFLWFVTWICQNWDMGFSKLLHSLGFYMGLSKLLHMDSLKNQY